MTEVAREDYWSPRPALAELQAPDELPPVLSESTRALIRRRRAGELHARGWMMRRALALSDLAGLLLAFLLAEHVFGENVPNASDAVAPGLELALFTATLPLWVVMAKLYGLYDRDDEQGHSSVDDLVGVFNMVTLGTWVFLTVCWLTGIASPSLSKLTLFWVAAIALVPGARVGARALCRRSPSYVQNTLVVGGGQVGQRVARKLRQHREYGVNLLGFVEGASAQTVVDLPVLGDLDDLPRLVRTLAVDRVILAFPEHVTVDLPEVVRALDDLDVRVDIVPRVFQVLGTTAHVHALEGMTLLGLAPRRLPRSSLLLKRMSDIVLSALALALLAPAFAALALAIKLDSRGPVFFRQVRMGQGGRSFRILKFRTMVADADLHKGELVDLSKHALGDSRMFKVPHDPRVTRVGRVLRRLSLDELPQLWNVLRGQMSLVGPRPLILEEARYVDGWGRRRLDLKPGITGLWQVLGRDDIPFGEMVELDYLYVTNWSLGGDLKLVLRTLPALAQGHSV